MQSKIDKLKKNPDVLRYLVNSSWMLGEYLLKVASAIFVGIYVARYLGPEKFGVLSYAIAILGVFLSLTRLGMDSILVREISKKPEQLRKLMGTAHSLMLIAALVGMILMGVVVYYAESDPLVRSYLWYISIALIFQTFLVIDYSFQGQVKVRYASVAKSIALALSSVIKIALVWGQADLLYFILAYVVDHLLIMAMLLIAYFSKKQPGFLFLLDACLAKSLLKSAWPMVLSALAVILYMRIDQIMIGEMLGSYQLGLYAAAVKIYEGWILVPYIISVSLLPAIVKLKAASPEKYELNMARLFGLLFWSGVVVAVVSSLWGEWIVLITFGDEYSGAGSVLGVVMWAAAFTALGSVTARYLTVEGMERKIAFRTFLALVINVVLNFVLIPIYGIEGAAVATLITIVTTNYLINYFDSELQQLLKIANRAMTLRLVA